MNDGERSELLDLEPEQPIFVGFKMDSSLRRQVEGLAGPDRKYVSGNDSTFLRVCKLGDDTYIGKLIHERLTTDRVDDVRRNVVSILNRLFPETRLPPQLEIFAARGDSEQRPAFDAGT